jgi:hypothetical protein
VIKVLNNEVGENSCCGYQYEPNYTEEDLAAAAATNEESTNNEEDEAGDRLKLICLPPAE